MTNKLILPAAMVVAFLSANAFAHGGDRDDRHGNRHGHGHRHHHDHRWAHPDRGGAVYVAPRVVYRTAPAVYQQPVVYQTAPVYYERAVVYPGYDSDRVLGQAIGAIAGGVIGNQIGHGHIGPTAIGAVVGGVVGGNLVDR